MIVMESGPFDLFGRLRGWAFNKQLQPWVIDGLNCVLCISFWLALVGAFFTGENWLLSWLGIAGAVAVIHLWIGEK